MNGHRSLGCVVQATCPSSHPDPSLVRVLQYLTMKLLWTWAVACLAAQAAGAAINHKLDGFTIREHSDPAKRALLQKYVWVVHTRITLVLLTVKNIGYLG